MPGIHSAQPAQGIFHLTKADAKFGEFVDVWHLVASELLICPLRLGGFVNLLGSQWFSFNESIISLKRERDIYIYILIYIHACIHMYVTILNVTCYQQHP